MSGDALHRQAVALAVATHTPAYELYMGTQTEWIDPRTDQARVLERMLVADNRPRPTRLMRLAGARLYAVEIRLEPPPEIGGLQGPLNQLGKWVADLSRTPAPVADEADRAIFTGGWEWGWGGKDATASWLRLLARCMDERGHRPRLVGAGLRTWRFGWPR